MCFSSLQGICGYLINSGHYWLVQFLSFKNLHFSISHGWATVAGCLPLRSPVWSLCTHFCILKKGQVLEYLQLDFSFIIIVNYQMIMLWLQITASSCQKCQHMLFFSSPQVEVAIGSVFSPPIYLNENDCLIKNVNCNSTHLDRCVLKVYRQF